MSDFKSETGNRYGLVWKNHTEEVSERCKTEIPTIKMINSRNIWAVDAVKQTSIFDNYHTRPHILIEGDNYHALKVLVFTHAGKIDVIYIDPPYNTGNKDFMYNDKFVDKEDSYRHSKWLSFMYKRLLLARELLSDTGVIFISIDDKEQPYLRALCNELFGTENYVNSIIWRKRKSQANLKKHIVRIHEHILIYAKNYNLLKFNMLPVNESLFNNPDNDQNGPWSSQPLIAGKKTNNKEYTFVFKNSRQITAKWIPSKSTLNQYEIDKKIYWPDTENGLPRRKMYLKDRVGMKPNTLWTDTNVFGDTESAGNEIGNILGDKTLFATPKPVKLIKEILKISTTRNSTVLDFFAGSGTTGHAVLELNKEDGGNRQFILCTNNENNICTDVCYPRVKKVIEGYKTPKGKVVEGIPANLVYFTCGRNKTGSSAFMPIIGNSDPDVLKLEIAQHSTGIIKTIENTYIEESKRLVENTEELEYMILRNGGKKEHGNKYVAIYYTIYDENLKELRDKMNAIKKKGIEKVLYYFTLDDELYTEDFKEWDNTLIKMFPKDFFNKFLDIAKRGIEYHYI